MIFRTRYASKTQINLAVREVPYALLGKAAAALAAILLLSWLTAYFGVLQPLARLDAAEAAYRQADDRNRELLALLEDYPAVQRRYRSVSTDWMGESASLIDRQEVLTLIEQELMTRGVVESVHITGETVDVTMAGMDLEAISEMFLVLEASPIVSSASLEHAASEKGDTQAEQHLLSFAFTMRLCAAETEAGQ